MQSEKRTLSRRYLENYFSGVWKSIAGGDNDHRPERGRETAGAEKGRIYRIADAHIRTLPFSLSSLPPPSFSLSPTSCIFLFSLVYLSDQYRRQPARRMRERKRKREGRNNSDNY